VCSVQCAGLVSSAVAVCEHAVFWQAMARRLLPHVTSDAKWRRKAATFALGEGAPLTQPVVDALCLRLKRDPSVYVRAVAAGALGCLYRRSIAARKLLQSVPRPDRCRSSASAGTAASAAALQEQIIDALLAALEVEQSRLDQGLRYPSRSSANTSYRAYGLKMWRPCDENDVCEGGGIVPTAGELAAVALPPDRFQRVRSTVRENVGWSLVMVTTHTLPTVPRRERLAQRLLDGLRTVIHSDPGIVSVGFAIDALHRLAATEPSARRAAMELLDPTRCLLPAESVCRTQWPSS
jgi:hypothetical protein